MQKRKCISCNRILVTRHQIKFCSNKCQKDYQHQQFIIKWRAHKISGDIGILTRGTSKYIRTYLIKYTGEKCSACGWNKRNKITGKVPLEVDHIDGNAENNTESNLRLLCPNCHSLTPFFRNLNYGRGRAWRIKQIRKKNDVLLK